MKKLLHKFRVQLSINYLQKLRKEFTDSVSYVEYRHFSEIEKFKYNTKVDIFDRVLTELKK